MQKLINSLKPICPPNLFKLSTRPSKTTKESHIPSQATHTAFLTSNNRALQFQIKESHLKPHLTIKSIPLKLVSMCSTLCCCCSSKKFPLDDSITLSPVSSTPSTPPTSGRATPQTINEGGAEEVREEMGLPPTPQRLRRPDTTNQLPLVQSLINQAPPSPRLRQSYFELHPLENGQGFQQRLSAEGEEYFRNLYLNYQ